MDEAPRSWTDNGAVDDDPSGIATYTQAGAQFGYGPLWTILLTYALMVATQSVSARLGRVTGRGLATNLRRHTSAPRRLDIVIVWYSGYPACRICRVVLVTPNSQHAF